MKSLNLFVVEDDPIVLEDITDTFCDLGHNVIGSSNSAEHCLETFNSSVTDLLVLDIDLGKNKPDGVYLAKKIQSETKCPFIYLTGFYDDQTLSRAAATQPKAYVLKPFSDKDLKVAIEIAYTKTIHQERKSAEIPKYDEKIFVKDKGSLFPVTLKDVHFFSAYDNYCYIHLQDKKYLVLQRLKDFLKFSSAGFLRIHRSHIVNIEFITQITEDFVFLGTTKLPIGKSYKKDFLNALQVV